MNRPPRQQHPAASSPPVLDPAGWHQGSSSKGLLAGVVVTVLTHVGGLQALEALSELDRDPPPAATSTYEVALLSEQATAPEPPPPVEDVTEPEALAEADEAPAQPEEVSAAPVEDSPSDSEPYDEPAAAPSEASEVLTADADERGPVDMTGEGWDMVSGKGNGPGYGYQSGQGSSRKATLDRRARLGGSPGGTGSGTARPATPSGPDRSRSAGLLGGAAWSCPFPGEADRQQIHRASAIIVVTVSPAGRPSSVQVVSDPGYGFGQAARQCAYGRSYRPALDRTGTAIAATTPPIVVRFRR